MKKQPEETKNIKVLNKPVILDPIVSGRQWIQALDLVDIGAFTIDSRRTITSCNQTLCTIMGWKPEDILEKDCRDVFKGMPCHQGCPLGELLGDDSTDPESDLVDDPCAQRLLTRLVTPIYEADGRVAGCLTIMQDQSHVSDLIHRVDHDERNLKIILDNLDIGIFTINLGGYVTFFNTAAEKISGYDRTQILGQPCQCIFREREKFAAHLIERVMATNQSMNDCRMEIVTPSGIIVPVKADYMPLINEQGKTVGGLVTLLDLTLAQQLDQVIHERYSFHNMIGKDPSMQRIFETVEVVAVSDATILIQGATGTGKDLLAHIIHNASGRRDKPFVKVNCAALPDNLLESEIFGYLKGAFTGADRNKPGRFQDADGGTIFLDEIGDFPINLQAKLLRVLDDREFYPLGSRHTQKVDVRIISATNRDLETLVMKSEFREDLYYRLNVVRIDLPELKDRPADLPLLIGHIVRKLCAAMKKPPMHVSTSALEILFAYDYPGNVRELENILEHALIICQDGIIKPEHLHGYLSRKRHTGEVDVQQLISHEQPSIQYRERILGTLQKYNWHRSKTARALGMDRTTLWRKMKKLGLTS